MSASPSYVVARVDQMLLEGWDGLPMPAKQRLCETTRLDGAVAAVVERFGDRLHGPCIADAGERVPGMVGWLLDETGRMAVIEVAVAYSLEWDDATGAHRRRLLRRVLSTAYVTAARLQDCLGADPDGDRVAARWTKVAVLLWRQARLAEGGDPEAVEVLVALLTSPNLTFSMHPG